jgi:hypothetical protein
VNLPASVREIIARAARCAAKRRRSTKRRTYLHAYHHARRIAVAVRKAK